MKAVARTLARLEPDDLWPASRRVDLKERYGEMDPSEAARRNDGIYAQMGLRGLKPDDLICPVVEAPRLRGAPPEP